MANSVASLTVTDTWYDGKREHVVGTVVLTNFNYITNGIPLVFTGQEFIKSATAPVLVNITGVAGFMYVWDYTNSTIRIFQIGAIASTPFVAAPITELIGGSPLTSGVSTDTIKLYALFKLI